jgi:hypothetical protein
MRRSFKLALKPFSINSMYYKDHSKKTAAYREWETLAFYELAKPGPQQAFADLRAAFDAEKHVYRMRVVCRYPRSTFITLKGTISSKTFDITNTEKILIDLCFLPKFHVQQPPYGAKNLNVDDKYLFSLNSAKRCSSANNFSIDITIWLEDVAKYV